jgi:hypothetical protein
MTDEFNAIDYANELESAGVPKNQAQVHARALTKLLGGAVFRRELDALRAEMHAGFKALEARIEALELVLRAEITSVRADVRIVASELKVHRWLLGISVALQLGVILILVFP